MDRKAQSSRRPSKPIQDDFSNHFTSDISPEDLVEVKGRCSIKQDIEIISPRIIESPEDAHAGFSCAYEIFFSECGLFFSLPELLIALLWKLKISLPQLCPNFIRIVLCLQTLAEKHGFILTLADLLHLSAVKKGRSRGTFYLRPRKGLRVFEDFPDKDE